MSLQDLVTNALKDMGNNYEQIGFFSHRELKNESDEGDRLILMYPSYMGYDKDLPFLKSEIYGNIKTDKDKNYPVTAGYLYGIPDAMFDRYNNLKNVDKESAKDFKPKQVFYAMVLDLFNIEKGVQKYQMSLTVAKAVLNNIADSEIGRFYSHDTEEGIRYLKIKKTGTGINTKYSCNISVNQNPLWKHIQAHSSKKLTDEEAKELALSLQETVDTYDYAYFVRPEVEETYRKLAEGEPYNPEEARKLRAERDSLFGRPFKFYLASSSEDTDEDFENRQRVKREDENSDLPFSGIGEVEQPEEKQNPYIGYEATYENKGEVHNCVIESEDSDGKYIVVNSLTGKKVKVPKSLIKVKPKSLPAEESVEEEISDEIEDLIN